MSVGPVFTDTVTMVPADWANTVTALVYGVFNQATTVADARVAFGLGTLALQNSNNVSITGGAIDGTVIGAVTPASGRFTSAAVTQLTPTVPGSLTSKQYVDTQISQVQAGIVAQVLANAIVASKVNRSGDTMYGPLTLSGDPTAPLQAATMQYVDAVSTALTTYQAAVRAPTGASLVGYGSSTVKATLDSLVAGAIVDRTVTVVAATSAGQLVFPIPGGYPIGAIDAYFVGIHLVNGIDYAATDGLNVTLASSYSSKVAVGNNLVINGFGTFNVANAIQASTLAASGGAALVGYGSTTVKQALDTLSQSFATARAITTVAATSAGQLVFPIPGGYLPNMFDAYLLGAHLINGVDYSATDGLNVTLSSDAAANVTPGVNLVLVGLGTFNVANAVQLSTLGASGGAALVGYGSQTVKQALDTVVGQIPLTNYAALRTYTGAATTVSITAPGVSGVFGLLSSASGLSDNGGVIVFDALGRAWKRLFTGGIQVEWFGALGDGTTNDSTPIQSAINYASAIGGVPVEFSKPVYRASGLIIKTGVVLEGTFKESVIIKAPDGWNNVSVAETYNFDFYKKSAGNPTDANTPDACGLRNITIDANAENFGGTASVTSGYALRMGATRMVLDNVRIQAAPGTGLHTSLGAITRLTTDWYRKNIANGYIRNLSIYASRNDGWVHDGPQDLYIETVDIGVSGFPDTATFIPNTGSGGSTVIGYPSFLEPARRVCNYTQNCAAEIGWMHSFGCRQGFGVLLGAATNGTQAAVRCKFTTMIIESCNGGLWTRSGAYYQGNVLDIHNCFGVDGQAYWLDNDTLQEGHIDNVRIYVQANNNGQDLVQLYGQQKSIGHLAVEGTNCPSTAVAFDGQQNKVLSADINQCRKTTGADGTVNAIRINATCAEWQCNAYVRNSDVVANYLPTASTARPIDSTIVSAFGNWTPAGGPAAAFIGFSVLSTSYRRNILLQSLSNDIKSRGYCAISSMQTIPSGTYTPGTTVNLFLTINAIFAPNPEEITLDFIYQSGGIPQVEYMAVHPSALSPTQIVVLIAFTAAATLNYQVSATVA